MIFTPKYNGKNITETQRNTQVCSFTQQAKSSPWDSPRSTADHQAPKKVTKDQPQNAPHVVRMEHRSDLT